MTIITWVYPQTDCDVIAALLGQKPIIMTLRV